MSSVKKPRRTRSSVNGVGDTPTEPRRESRKETTKETTSSKKPSKRSTPNFGAEIASQSSSQTRPHGYERGSIVKLKLSDFMTYESVEVDFGPDLNMIVGPNGSGKSAILCALLVGLSGETGVTGRATNVQDYIRLGAEEAHIVIELYNPHGQNDIIHRTISRRQRERRDPESSWQLNGRKVNKDAIKQHVAQLNLKVDNLCQFLPQERVVEFVKMSPKELLKNTEKAAGDQDMFNNHERLETLSADLKTLIAEVSKMEKDLDIQQILHNQEEEDFKRVQEKENIEKEIEWLKLKKPWAQYEEKRLEYIKMKRKLKDKEKEFKELNVNDRPLREQLASCKTHISRAQTAIRDANTKMLKAKQQANHTAENLGDLEERMKDLKAEYEHKLAADEHRLTQLRQNEEQLKMTEKRLQEIANENMNQDFGPQIRKMEAEMDKLTRSIRILNSDIEKGNDKLHELERNLQMKKQYLNRKKQVFDKRLETLRASNSNAYSAYDILKRHQDQFKDEEGNPTIYPPLLTLVDVHDPKDAKYVEMSVGKHDWFAFVCTTPESLQEFTRLVREKLGSRINVILAPSRSPEEFQPNVSINDLKRRGMQARYANELFKAPDPVMAYLCQTYMLHEIPLVTQAERHLDYLRTNFKRFYSEGQCFINRKSRYDNETVTNNDMVQEAKLLVHFINHAEIDNLETELAEMKEQYQSQHNALTDLKREKQETEAKIQDLRKEKNRLLAKKDEKRELEVKKDALNERIKRLNKDAMDKQKELALLRRGNADLLKRMDSTLSSMNKILKDANENFRKKIAADASLKRLKHEEVQVSELLEREQRAAETQRKQLELFRREVENCKKQALDLHTKATDKSYERFRVREWEGIPEDSRTKLESLPDNVKELEDLIVANQMKLNSIRSRHIDVEEFKRRSRNIKNRKAELEGKRSELKNKQEEMERIRNRWQEPLLTLIGQINTNFSSLMARLGYAGQVELDSPPPDDPNDFDKYGVIIKVKFRDAEPLKELKPSHQSGGERSVATMIYMIALQELTKVPFRCVDEINQGMDETNERRVFDLIVETAKRNSSQYMLFSPKLLSGLNYIDTMRIHIVFNSPHLKFIWKQPEALA